MEQQKTLLIWEGPVRPYKKQDKKFYANMISLVIVMGVFLFVAGQWPLIVVLLSLLFASYALYSQKPPNTTYAITNKGIVIDKEVIEYDKIQNFFVTKSLDETLINFDLKLGFLKRRFMIPNNVKTLEKAEKILKDYIFEKPVTKQKPNVIMHYLDKFGLKFK